MHLQAVRLELQVDIYHSKAASRALKFRHAIGNFSAALPSARPMDARVVYTCWYVAPFGRSPRPPGALSSLQTMVRCKQLTYVSLLLGSSGSIFFVI
jgi:hypothetical protein